ncbi:hypothetical protein COLO4_37404 [Corchorus olitorius]|uniref:Uncharacterized protein n=1 Tax=Corchorus olitorius TaxID=93759 RepID=A0A1R3G206_9ROSI|nr:hypothetical protein COLO4_37404 [Corchorus olitorius]
MINRERRVEQNPKVLGLSDSGITGDRTSKVRVDNKASKVQSFLFIEGRGKLGVKNRANEAMEGAGSWGCREDNAKATRKKVHVEEEEEVRKRRGLWKKKAN